jgi:hypothetical protein
VDGDGTTNGRYYNGRIDIGGAAFLVTRSGNGIRVTQIGESTDTLTLSRSGGGNWGGGNDGGGNDGGSVPGWLKGTFWGHHRNHDKDVEFTVSRNGEVVRRVWDNSGRMETANGNYSDGGFNISGTRFRVSSRGNGFYVVKDGDRSDNVTVRRGRRPGSSGGNFGNVPDWAIGNFRGFHRNHRKTVEMSINQDGSVTRYVFDRGEDRLTSDGRLEDDTLIFGRDRFLIRRRNNGIYVEKEGDRSDNVTLYRN